LVIVVSIIISVAFMRFVAWPRYWASGSHVSSVIAIAVIVMVIHSIRLYPVFLARLGWCFFEIGRPTHSPRGVASAQLIPSKVDGIVHIISYFDDAGCATNRSWSQTLPLGSGLPASSRSYHALIIIVLFLDYRLDLLKFLYDVVEVVQQWPVKAAAFGVFEFGVDSKMVHNQGRFAVEHEVGPGVVAIAQSKGCLEGEEVKLAERHVKSLQM